MTCPASACVRTKSRSLAQEGAPSQATASPAARARTGASRCAESSRRLVFLPHLSNRMDASQVSALFYPFAVKELLNLLDREASKLEAKTASRGSAKSAPPVNGLSAGTMFPAQRTPRRQAGRPTSEAAHRRRPAWSWLTKWVRKRLRRQQRRSAVLLPPTRLQKHWPRTRRRYRRLPLFSAGRRGPVPWMSKERPALSPLAVQHAARTLLPRWQRRPLGDGPHRVPVE